MKLEAANRLKAHRTQDWYSKLTAEEKEAYLDKFPGTRFHHKQALVVPASVSLTFKDAASQPIVLKFANAEAHGTDGNGSTVYSAQQGNGFFTVLIVSPKGRLFATAANNLTRGEAKAMADHAVETQAKRYWDSARAIERYHLLNNSKYQKV